jgi:hypothetical protein
MRKVREVEDRGQRSDEGNRDAAMVADVILVRHVA